MRRVQVAAVVAAGLMLAGCGGGGSAPASSSPAVRTPPDLAAFLRQPVATPSTCPSTVPAATVNRTSPWVGHVDLSVFLADARPVTVKRIGHLLDRAASVEQSYYESPAQAYAEFQRLYTCWTRVPRSQTPASYRVVLVPTATIAARNRLAARMLRQPGVDTISCDPSLPCTDVVRSAH